MTPTTAARFVGVSKETVYQWLRSGKLKAHRVPGFAIRRILRSDLDVLKRKRARR